MNHLNKLLIAFINIIFFVSCASNIQDNSYQSKELISIDKPKVVYNFKKLPKRINVFLLDTNQTTEREFINGLSINYYYYKNLSNYSPEINFITSKKIDEGNCKLNKDSQDYSIILLNDAFLGSLDPYCLNKLLNLNGILILSSDNLKVKELNQEVLHVNRQNEYRDLLTYAKNNRSKNSLIIDDENTRDKDILTKIWLNLEGKVLDSSTSGSNLNENLLSNLLLIERSKERSRKLSRILSVPLESTPRRRMDLDSIILSVSLTKARSLKPELEYNYGESLQVYLLPNWENDEYYLKKELDLERVVLIDMPWMLNTEINYLRNLPKKRNRSFAIGYDAYEIALLLNNSSSSKQFQLSGMSGKIIYYRGSLLRKSPKVSVQDGLFKMIGY